MENRRSTIIGQQERGTGLFPLLVVLFCIAALPLIFRTTKFPDYLTYIAARIMILAIFAMSFDLLLGYTGVLQFGHALFLGGGAYTLGILMVRFPIIIDVVPGILVASVVGIILGLFLGYLASGVGRVAVFIVTFGITEVFRLLVLSDPMGITNGENGIAGIQRLQLFKFINIRPELHYYYLVLVLLCLSFLALRAITRSPFGDVLIGIRDNVQRIRFLGYNVRHFKIAAFTISGLFASLSGALTALHEGSTSPEMFHWFFSGDALIYTVLGGPGTLIGPFLGAVIAVILQEIFSDLFHNWLIFLGIGYIALIMFLPNGLFRLFQKVFSRETWHFLSHNKKPRPLGP